MVLVRLANISVQPIKHHIYHITGKMQTYDGNTNNNYIYMASKHAIRQVVS